MKRVRVLFIGILSALISGGLYAQSAVDGMTLMGVAEFTELRRPYYIAAFYSDSPASGTDLMLVTHGRRRMEMRVTAKNWRPRRFSIQWTQGVLINNDADALLDFDDTFIQFNNLLDTPFRVGDIIIVDSFIDGSSKVIVNGIEAMSVSKSGFFELLLSKWIGSRPPSSEFKAGIMGGSGDASLVARFEEIQPSSERVALVQRFFKNSIEGVRQSDEIVIPKEAPIVEVVAIQVQPAEPDVPPPAVVETLPAPQEPSVAIVEEEPPAPEPEIDLEVYAQQQEVLMTLYQTSVARRVLRNVKYPSRAVDRNQQGRFQVQLLINRGGNVINVEFLEKSKYKLLSRAAISAIEKTGKMPPVPAGLDGESINVIIPFAFKLS